VSVEPRTSLNAPSCRLKSVVAYSSTDAISYHHLNHSNLQPIVGLLVNFAANINIRPNALQR